MTKYLDKSFNSPANNKNYRDNYDRIFGKKCKRCDGTGYLEPESEDPWGPCPECSPEEDDD